MASPTWRCGRTIRAGMDAAVSDRAAAFRQSEGGAMSILFAATYPKRRRATRQLARNDLDTMIRTPVVLAALGIGSRAKRFGAPLVLQSARWRCLANRELNGVAVFHRRR